MGIDKVTLTFGIFLIIMGMLLGIDVLKNFSDINWWGIIIALLFPMFFILWGLENLIISSGLIIRNENSVKNIVKNELKKAGIYKKKR